ncbi:MAG: CHC2 zinc finger domain-containing protein [bacterium]
MYYTKKQIELVENSIKIEEEIADYIKLKKKGAEYLGLCPFHDDKKPSFSVSPKKQIFKCWGCGIGGNIFKFIQKKMNFNFISSVKFLILKNQIELDEFGYSGKGDVYVLKLEDRKYYIGYTENLPQRMESHFSGRGSKWTKEYKPLEIVKVYKGVNRKFETELTELYMKKYGYRIIRGGDHVRKDLKFKHVKKKINNKTNEGVYILKLEEDKFFIGYNVNMDSAIDNHFDGQGCEWTKKYKPVKLVSKYKTRNIEECKKETISYIKKFGWDNVRGYRWKKDNIRKPKILS